MNLLTSHLKIMFNNKLYRFVWSITWSIFARPIPRRLFNQWKILLLRLFGAKIHSSAIIYSNARIYMPRNLEMEEFSILGAEADCYNVSTIKLGKYAIVSQKAYLCSASHDFTKSNMPLITAPIIIEDHAWVAADVYIGMGVTIGEGAVIGARACVYKDVEPWSIMGGNPAKFIKKRVMKD